MTMRLSRFILAGVLPCLTLTASLSAASGLKDDKNSKDEDARRPKLSLKASPSISMAPSRVVISAEFNGGANDYEEYYCPTVEWEWGDGTQSESTFDCQPYEAGKSEIKRRFTVEHVFRPGMYHVVFRLKHHDKALVSATTNVQVQPGLRDIN